MNRLDRHRKVEAMKTGFLCDDSKSGYGRSGRGTLFDRSSNGLVYFQPFSERAESCTP